MGETDAAVHVVSRNNFDQHISHNTLTAATADRKDVSLTSDVLKHPRMLLSLLLFTLRRMYVWLWRDDKYSSRCIQHPCQSGSDHDPED